MSVDIAAIVRENLAKFTSPREAEESFLESCSALGINPAVMTEKDADRIADHLVGKGGLFSFVGRALRATLISEKLKYRF